MADLTEPAEYSLTLPTPASIDLFQPLTKPIDKLTVGERGKGRRLGEESKKLRDLAIEGREIGDYKQNPGTAYSPALHEEIVAAYFREGCNLAAAARVVGVPYSTLQKWRSEYLSLAADLLEVEQIINEEAHGLFVRKVLNKRAHIPTWLIYWLKNHDPRYAEKPKQSQKRVEVVITDNTLKTPPRALPRTVGEVVKAEVI